MSITPDALGAKFAQGKRREQVMAKDHDGNEIVSQVGHSEVGQPKELQESGLLAKLVHKSAGGVPAAGMPARQADYGAHQGAIQGNPPTPEGEGDFGPPGGQDAVLRRVKESVTGPNARVAPRAASPARTPKHHLAPGGKVARPPVGNVNLRQPIQKGPAGVHLLNSAGGLKAGDKIQFSNRVWIVVDTTPTSILMISPSGIRHWEFRHKLKNFKLMSKGNSFEHLVL